MQKGPANISVHEMKSNNYDYAPVNLYHSWKLDIKDLIGRQSMDESGDGKKTIQDL